ncbi:MAG: UDP-3-O-acyl-N-acetylglucosamine deacetylase [Thalassococcus sp.]|uniref:UDP-3-O-acyl-N-acetylglucosamine deacetylase n=1 Tax=Thalassococcus sp. TaxID=1928858 RepID=UPI001B06F1FC|nr:UDP-3-O-acyl-N-acetylglucosamine deacetylase [Thalassococcus sp.]MBO6866808.1 UDP-3-O-acyl-N-acetylglucosamine deacetylase [Thalassococcus sp.]
MQHTVRGPIVFDGVGLHSGKPARLTIRPAAAEHGIWFKRTDIRFGDALIPALWDAVERSPLCTRLVNGAGASVSTVEHVMAALAGCGVHNALIEIDGPEVPILDGSAVPFVTAILDKGLRGQAAPLRVLEIIETVQVHTASGWARLSPSDTPRMTFRIEFADEAIGTQEKSLDMSNGTFVRELSDSRTFCRNSDVEAMREQGLALGGTLENAVVVDGDKVLSPGGLRHADEAVRHKMLDALGDLMLAGAPILGHYEGHKAGHAITNMLLHALFSTPTAFRMIECTGNIRAKMPGVGVLPEEIPEVA